VNGRSLQVWFLIYCGIALVLFRALVPRIASGFPHDAGDPVLSAWALWWNAHHVPFVGRWWDGLAFYPEHGSLAFSDHRVGLGLIASPILWLGGGPILAHNAVFLLSFPLCAIGAHVLAREITSSDLAGLIAGLTFGFNPYRMDHLPHLELLAAWWLPVVLLALHRYLRDGSARWLVLFAASLALQGLSCGYYFFFAVPLLAAWILWFVRPVRRILPIGIAWAAAVVPLLPALVGYTHFLGRLNLHREYPEVRLFSADMTGLVSPSPLIALWHSSPAVHRQEGDIFTGVFAIALVGGGVLLSLSRRSPPVTRLRRVQVASLVLAVIFEAAALSALTGGWSVRIAGATIAAHDTARPATVAVVLLVIAALTSPAGVDALRRRSPLAFYSGAAVVMWLFTLGPVPLFLGERALFHGPYAYLMSLPGFATAFRVPARFAMLMAFALSMAAACAFVRVTANSRAAVRRGFGVCMAAGILLDSWITGLPVVAAPDRWQWPAEITRAAGVLELPLGGDLDEIAAVWRSMEHGKPVINGYSGYDPPHHRLLRLALERHDTDVLSGVAEYGPILIAIDTESAESAFWRSALASIGATAATDADTRRTFVMLPRREGPATPPGTPLRLIAGSASTGRFVLRDLTDGNPSTFWVSTGLQRGDERVHVQLDGLHRVSGVILSMAASAESYPRRLRIETSLDGATWNVATDEAPAGMAFSAIVRNFARTQLSFRLADVESQYVRLCQLGRDPHAFWFISDITVLGQ
jgi:F5/8 type C domain-containing protein